MRDAVAARASIVGSSKLVTKLELYQPRGNAQMHIQDGCVKLT